MQGVDDAYSEELLEVARELYAFGDEYRLEYHLSITDATDFYRYQSKLKTCSNNIPYIYSTSVTLYTT